MREGAETTMSGAPISMIGRAIWLQSVDDDNVSICLQFGDAPDNSRDPAADESKKLV
jgi:hypothetical protein